jgi:hypothetical protein
MNSNKRAIVKALQTAKKPLVYSEILSSVQVVKQGMEAETLDQVLFQAAKAGLIDKDPISGRGRSRYVYSVAIQPSTTSIIRSVITKTKLDSLEVFLAVKSVKPTATKQSVDSALYSMSKAGEIIKSKNPMTDTNTISSQSKFLYGSR